MMFLPTLTGLFLSTPSARRATAAGLDCLRSVSISIHALREEGDLNFINGRTNVVLISIHALREEGDVLVLRAFPVSVYFYPRPPRGGRRSLLE